MTSFLIIYETLELPQKARDGFGKEAAAEKSPTPTVPSSTAPSTSISPPIPAHSSSKYPESAIKTLSDMGCSREEAINALEMTNGNVELAVGILFS
jgi:hypothetical protein